VVIPVYNSEPILQELIIRLDAALTENCSRFELLLINDGSIDKSWEKIQELALERPFIKGINLMRNYGQHNALLCGIREAQGDVIITMDDDLQHPPEEISKLLQKWKEGFDVVYGYPAKLPHSVWRNIFSRLTKKTLAFVMGIKSVNEISAFRAFSTDLRKAFASYQSPNVIIDVLLSWGTRNFSSVIVNENQRVTGKSNYDFFKLASQAFLILTGFSTIPLRLASWLGFVVMIFGSIVFLYVLISYFSMGSIPGFPFLASIISLFSGTQLFAIGIIGEYLARIFDRSMERPTYVIAKTTEIH
jgi:glycosyltransferase involved in cell wall biosynthesis